MHKFIFGAVLAFVSSSVWARPVAVFSGGFGSCLVNGDTAEMVISSRIDKLIDQISSRTHQSPIQIRTCFAIGSATIYVSAPELDIESQALSLDEFHDVVRQAAQLGGTEAPIYLWGFSHGGWVVMNLVAETEGLNYRVLTTNDPISVYTCNAFSFVPSIITGPEQGCLEPPIDLESKFSVIASRVERWINWYQTEFPLLHSGNIPLATENNERVMDASWWTITGAHGKIVVDPFVWQATAQAIIGDLSQTAQ
jgi:hypothetical protein